MALDPLRQDEHHSVEAMERRVEYLKRLAERRNSDEGYGDATDGNPTAYTARSHGRQSQHGDEALPSDPAMDDMSYLPLSALTEVRDRGTSENKIGFSTLLEAACASSNGQAMREDVEHTDVFSSELHPDSPRLSRIYAQAAIQQYSTLCDAQCPFLGGDRLTRNIDTFISGTSQSGEPEEKMLFDLAVATGTFLLKGYRQREILATKVIAQAKKSLSRAIGDFDGVAEVQSILAMAVLSNYSNSTGSMWHLVGLAVSRCFSLGLHTIVTAPCDQGQVSTQIRSRVFASAYILDAFVSFP